MGKLVFLSETVTWLLCPCTARHCCCCGKRAILLQYTSSPDYAWPWHLTMSVQPVNWPQNFYFGKIQAFQLFNRKSEYREPVQNRKGSDLKVCGSRWYACGLGWETFRAVSLLHGLEGMWMTLHCTVCRESLSSRMWLAPSCVCIWQSCYKEELK